MRQLPDPNLKWPICMDAVYLIANAEALRLKAYKDVAGIWTIGWGETDGVHPGDTCTKAQADAWMCDDLTDRVKAIQEMCTEYPSDNELGALTSLAYNIGLEGLRKSTVLRQHNAGNKEAAARAFALWNKARVNGELTELRGLTARRAAESALYLTPDPGERSAPMPQAVAPESSLAKSPIAQTGVVTAGAGTAIGVVAQFGDQLSPIVHKGKQFADTLGIDPMTAFALALLAVGLVAVYQRHKQRSQGWA